MEYQPPVPPVPPIPPPSEPPAAERPIPWEDPAVPWLSGLVDTVKMVLAHPGEAFRRVALTTGLGRPMLFAVIVGWIALLFVTAYRLAFSSSLRHAMEQMFPAMAANEHMAHVQNAVQVTIAALGPVVIVISIFLYGLL